MSDELKSAWELALEKLKNGESETPAKLTQEQKQEIAAIRNRFKAKIAEAEIATETKIRRAAERGAFEEFELLKSQLIEERNRLNRDMEREIARIRNLPPP
ncbi:MAG: hypothetical protein HY645_14030 [Acidobacteria bacterium]|nr:hypothetical protein [Acidobacteriota bacterium]